MRFSGHVGIAELLRKGSRDILVTDQTEALGHLPKAQIFLPLRDRYTIHIDLGELAGIEQQFAERYVGSLPGWCWLLGCLAPVAADNTTHAEFASMVDVTRQVG